MNLHSNFDGNRMDIFCSRACLRSAGESCSRKGDSARAANSMRAEVAAGAGSASFMMRPSGKFVPSQKELKSESSKNSFLKFPVEFQ